jgi:hypothetical protein
MKKLIATMISLFTRCFACFLLLWAANAQAQNSQSRPFTVYERFVLETEMVNQLQNALNNYLDPSTYQLKLRVEGRMVADADGRTAAEEKETASKTQEDLITMFPGLPFYDAKRKVEKPNEASSRSISKPLLGGTVLRGGPEITRMSVTLVTDTAVSKSEVDFYSQLLTGILRLDTLRGDVFTWQQSVFPAFKSKATERTDARFQGDEAVRVNLEGGALLGQMQRMADAFIFEWISSLIVIVLIVIFTILFFKRRQQSSKTGISTANRSAERQNELQNTPKSDRTVVSEMSSDVRAAEAAQPKEEKLLKWLLHDQRVLGLLIEKFTHEKGVVFLKQLVVLLAQYRGECAEMVCATLPDALRMQLEAELEQPPLLAHASEQALQLTDSLEEAFESYSRHGFFPFVLYLSDEELANLLQQEQAINCLLVFDGLSVERQSRVMALLDAEKNAEILNSYDALGAIRYAQYELLAVSLFARSVENRSAQQVAGQNITEIIKSIASQSLERQAMIMEDLRTKNQNLYQQMRAQLVLWSDLKAFAHDELRTALEVLNSSELVELLKGDLATQELLLPLRPAREQILLKEQLQNQTEPSPETEALRKQLLVSLYPFWNQAVSSNKSNNS